MKRQPQSDDHRDVVCAECGTQDGVRRVPVANGWYCCDCVRLTAAEIAEIKAQAYYDDLRGK